MSIRKPGRNPTILVLPLSRMVSAAAKAVGLVILIMILPLAGLLLLGPDAFTPPPPQQVLQREPLTGYDELAGGIHTMSNCDVPGWPDSRHYGHVGEADLPWFHEEPLELERLRRDAPAPRLVTAFHIAVKNPMFEEIHNITHAASVLAGSVVPPGEIFSLNGSVGPYTSARGYGPGPTYVGGKVVPTEGGGVCKIGTALYNTVLLSGLPVVERHPHSMIVTYVPPGRDAAIAYGAKDVRFRNDTEAPLVIWSQMLDNTLFIAFYGQHRPPKIEWHHQVLHQQEAPTIRRANPDLAANEEQVVIEGYPGYIVQTGMTVTYPGKEPERRDLGVDSYQPLPRIVEYGP